MNEKLFQLSDIKRASAQTIQQFQSLWRRLDLEQSKQRQEEIEAVLSQPNAWDDPDKLTPLLKEKSILEEWISELEDLERSKTSLEEWMELADEEQSQEALEALNEQYLSLNKKLNKIELKALLAAPEDKNNAILEIHPGAGGTEAQDWAEMLLRMYKRWAEDNNFHLDLLDYLPGDEAGLKSVTLAVEGNYAFGLLKGEKGIHRLIRISPFDTSGRRHTSFASVDVYPDVTQDIEIDVKDEDIRIDVFRSSGPGGQSVNKTSSAVRITHFPSGIVAQCQNEKSQFRNRESAFKILKARLYEQELQKQQEDKQLKYSSKNAIAWGSQIRTYTLQPYRLVKDHRTNTEDGNVDRILDGGLDKFIRNYLLSLHGQKWSEDAQIS
ncbi:MAG: peptide chain release factor 2 [Thermodesulfobacteriota bacterium]